MGYSDNKCHFIRIRNLIVISNIFNILNWSPSNPDFLFIWREPITWLLFYIWVNRFQMNIIKLHSQLEAEIGSTLKWSDDNFHDLKSSWLYFYNEKILFIYFKFMPQIFIKSLIIARLNTRHRQQRECRHIKICFNRVLVGYLEEAHTQLGGSGGFFFFLEDSK